MLKYFILCQFSMLIIFSPPLSGQAAEKKVFNQTLSLFVFNSNIEIAPKWFVTGEVQERSFIQPIRQSQLLLKSQMNYQLGQDWIAAAGMAYSLSSPGDPSSLSTLIVPELRLNQDLNYKQNFGTFNFGHRYRIEERFIRKSINGTLMNGYMFISRLSYQLSFEYNLFKSKHNFHAVTFKALDGVFINASKRIIHHRFDQNRFYAGLNFQVFKDVAIELGYLNLFQQRTSGDQFYNRDIASLAINYKIKIRK